MPWFRFSIHWFSLLFVGAVFAIFGGSLIQPFAAFSPSAHERHAVVLIHGLRNNGSVWDAKGYLASLRDHDAFHVAGHWEDDALRLIPKETLDTVPVFTLTLPENGTVDLRESAKSVASMLRAAHEQAGIDSFTLVGKSLGGIVAREYVSGPLYQDNVDHLITISSPHLGSELAYLPEAYVAMKAWVTQHSNWAWQEPQGWWDTVERTIAREATGWGFGLLKEAKELSLNAGYPIEAPGLRMLLPPEEGNYLAELNTRAHPTQIRYTAIIAKAHPGDYGWKDLRSDVQRLWDGDIADLGMLPVVADVGRSLLHVCRHGLDTHAGSLVGDGVVSEPSQDLSRVHAFRHGSGLRVETITLEAGHHQVHHHVHLPELLLPRLAATGALPHES